MHRTLFASKLSFDDLFKNKEKKLYSWTIHNPGRGSFIDRALKNPPTIYNATNLNELLVKESFISPSTEKSKTVMFLVRKDGTLVFSIPETALFPLAGQAKKPYFCLAAGYAVFDENHHCKGIGALNSDELIVSDSSLYVAIKAFVESNVPLSDIVNVRYYTGSGFESFNFTREEIHAAYEAPKKNTMSFS